MPEFLPDGSRWVFIGVASVLFTLMIGCFAYHKGKRHFKSPFANLKRKKMKGTASFKRGTRRNKFLMKKGEKADADDEGGAESQIDKIRAEIDLKYNNPALWSTEESGEPAAHLPIEMVTVDRHNQEGIL